MQAVDHGFEPVHHASHTGILKEGREGFASCRRVGRPDLNFDSKGPCPCADDCQRLGKHIVGHEEPIRLGLADP